MIAARERIVSFYCRPKTNETNESSYVRPTAELISEEEICTQLNTKCCNSETTAHSQNICAAAPVVGYAAAATLVLDVAGLLVFDELPLVEGAGKLPGDAVAFVSFAPPPTWPSSTIAAMVGRGLQ